MYETSKPKTHGEHLFTLSKKDFIVEFYRGSGKGGQKRNKTESCCRITHPASGAVAIGEDERSREQNKKIAFKRLVTSEKFKKWHRIEVARKLGLIADVEQEVEKQMRKENLTIEGINENGKWERI